jgi:diaminopimelate decarboxylase
MTTRRRGSVTVENITGLDAHRLVQLAETCGTPLWVYNLRRIRENAAALRSALDNRFPGALVAYSIKANQRPEVLGCIAATGLGAEAASFTEVEQAMYAGFPSEQIVFNGPWKTRGQIAAALRAGMLVNVDSMDELDVLLSLDLTHSRIGLRVALDFGEGMEQDRFGLDQSQLIQAGLALVARGLPLAALQAHWGSYTLLKGDGPTSVRTQVAWPQPGRTAQVLAQLLHVTRTIRDECGLLPDILDVGGGLPPTEGLGGELKRVAEVYQQADTWLQPRPRLLFEPGRALVWDAGLLLTRVVARRATSRGPAIVVDAATSVLPAAATGDLPLEPVQPHPGAESPTTVFGPLCLQTDVLAWSARLPSLEPGHLLYIPSVGAYNDARSAPFIFPLPQAVFEGAPEGPEARPGGSGP